MADAVVVLRAGEVRAEVHPADGGRLGQLVVDGAPLLRGPEHRSAGWSAWGSYPLLPWSNRVPGGRFRSGGRTFEVPVNWPDGSALHGLAAWVPWSVDAVSDTAVELSVEVRQSGYHAIGRQSLTLGGTRLDQELSMTNVAPWPVPAGLGIHPWFQAGPVRVPADRVWPGEPLPTGPPQPVPPDVDLRTLRLPPPMDRCLTGLTGTEAEVPGCTLAWSGPVTQVVVFSGDPQWVCVEPVTMANDGFGLAERGVDGTGVVCLEPGEALEVGYSFRFRR